MRAAPDPAVQDHIDLVAHRVNDLGKLIEGASGAATGAPMIRHHDRCRSDIRRAPGVRGAHDSFEQNCPSHSWRSSSASFQLIDWSSIVEKYSPTDMAMFEPSFT